MKYIFISLGHNPKLLLLNCQTILIPTHKYTYTYSYTSAYVYSQIQMHVDIFYSN